MIKEGLHRLWLVFVNIKPIKPHKFIDLIEIEDDNNMPEFIGAWANIIIKADDIQEVIQILPAGLLEKNFEVVFVDKIENMNSLVEHENLNQMVLDEANWINDSEFVFMISDCIYPYVDE
ncbi:MAG: hypothetical protein IPL23_09975 [Saprospiraceae bacterium]|nr:hypothetical protein [Saprospiraceae bacterium]MBK8634927.1 hypothetical protein [Saprospiraceae bacterium]HMS70848.1 hypothetical protein [Saprospiraceae bacterium]